MTWPRPLETVLFAISAALLVGAVFILTERPEGDQQARDFMALLDRDGDARLDPDEYATVSDGEIDFRVLDADRSGYIETWEVGLSIRHISSMKNSLSALPKVR